MGQTDKGVEGQQAIGYHYYPSKLMEHIKKNKFWKHEPLEARKPPTIWNIWADELRNWQWCHENDSTLRKIFSTLINREK